MTTRGPLTELEQRIALNLLHRTGAYLNYFISVDGINKKDGPPSQSVNQAADFLKEVSEFLKQIKE